MLASVRWRSQRQEGWRFAQLACAEVCAPRNDNGIVRDKRHNFESIQSAHSVRCGRVLSQGMSDEYF